MLMLDIKINPFFVIIHLLCQRITALPVLVIEQHVIMKFKFLNAVCILYSI